MGSLFLLFKHCPSFVYLLSLKVVNLHFQFIWNVACDLRGSVLKQRSKVSLGSQSNWQDHAATRFLRSGGHTLGGPDLLCVCLGVPQAMVEQECVGAIVCKLDMHKKMFRRGYIAMLAVDSKHRRKSIGESPSYARQTKRPSLLRGSVATESMVFFDKAISVQTEVPDMTYPLSCGETPAMFPSPCFNVYFESHQKRVMEKPKLKNILTLT